MGGQQLKAWNVAMKYLYQISACSAYTGETGTRRRLTNRSPHPVPDATSGAESETSLARAPRHATCPGNLASDFNTEYISLLF